MYEAIRLLHHSFKSWRLICWLGFRNTSAAATYSNKKIKHFFYSYFFFKARVALNTRNYLLSPSNIWDSNNSAIGNIRMTQKLRFDLQGTNFVATRLDDICRQTSKNFEISIIPLSSISSPKPSVRGKIFCCSIRLVPVAFKNIWSFD